MKVTCYDIRLNEKRKPSLVKEKEFVYDTKIYNSPKKIAEFFANSMNVNSYCEERANLLALNSSGNVIGVFELSKGTLSQAPVGIREIFIRMLLTNASAFVLEHNHPSNNPEPSQADIILTRNLKKASDIMGINFLDHVIVSNNIVNNDELNYYSFKQHNWQYV